MIRRKLKYEKEQLVATNNLLNVMRSNLKINEKKVFFESFHGKSMIGDPYAIFKYMYENEAYQDFTFVWVLSNISDVTDPKFLKDKRVKYIPLRGKEYMYHQSTAKIIINNTSMPASFIKKEGQIYLNTWHGTPYKTLGKDMKGPRATHANLTSNFLKSDYMLHTCEYTQKKIEQSHDIEDLWSGEALICAPRFALCQENELISDYLKNTFSWNPEEETILYAPTWKGNLHAIDDDFTDIIKDFVKMKEMYPKKNILMKVHSLIFSRMNEAEKKYVINDKYDMNEIMYYVDTLITDYSSSFFDFAALNKKIIHYMPDYEYYQTTRGLYLTQDELPGYIAYNQEELIAHINKTEPVDYTKFNEKFNPLNSLLSIEQLLEKLKSTPVASYSHKKNVLVYAGGFEANGITKSFINLTKKWDYDKYNLIVIDKNIWREDQNSTLEQIDERVKFIYRCGRLVMGRTERVKYHEFIKNPTKEENYPYVQRIMDRERKRTIGDAKIDVVLDFSGYMYFWSLYLLSLPIKQKYIFQHSNMLLEEKKVIDGSYIHREKLNIEFNIYNKFGKIIAVSKETMEENYKNLKQYYPLDKAMYIENYIDEDEIISKQAISSLQLRNVLATVEMHKEKIIRELVIKAKISEELKNDNMMPSDEIVPLNQKFLTVGYFGRISPEKGQVEFIKKLPELLEYYPKMIVIICGLGPDKAEIERLVVEMNVENHVILPGYISNPYALMKKLDYTTLLSFTEGQPMVLLESLLVGTKVIASDIPGCKSVLQGKYGICVENNLDGVVTAFNDQTEYEKFNVIDYNREIKRQYEMLLG